jgi:hypothetical protein
MWAYNNDIIHMIWPPLKADEQDGSDVWLSLFERIYKIP